MQKFVLFIEPQENEHRRHSQLGNLFMNRFSIDEDGNSEILKIFELPKSFARSIQSVTKREKGQIILD